MVKLDDVAKLAGVSKGTASRVLNNRGYISQQTRERIEAAVKELNYYPNENARNLLKRRSGMIGVVVPTITYPYYSEMISFLEKFLKASGYKILLCNTSFSSGASQDYIKLLNNNRVDGAIIFNYKLTEQDYASLSFPIVSIDRHTRDEASYVASDHVQGGTLAADCLLRCGCRHVIQIGGSFEDDAPWNIRHQVFRDIMAKHQVDCFSYEQVRDSHTFHDYRQIVLGLLREHPETDGIFCNDLCAAAVLNAAMSLQLRVPEQLKIIGYDGTFLSEIVTPSITTVWQNTEKIASSAADIIVKMIDDPSFSSYHLTLGVRLIERDSTRCG